MCPGRALDREQLRLLADDIATRCEGGPDGGHPCFAGAEVLVGTADGGTALHHAVGWALRHRGYDPDRDAAVELPPDRRLPMRPGTVFDLASLTKPFTAVVALQQLERGRLGLDEPAARRLPAFAAKGKDAITVRHLLSHTSGLRPELPFYERATEPARRALLWDEEPLHRPGTARVYSDLNMIALQWLLEAVTGVGLDTLVREGITAPLGMRSTRFAPPPVWRTVTAATEDQRKPWGKLNRGLVHGQVHDENAYAFGGVAGHAGLFSTAADLAVFCRALLRGGGRGGARILQPGSVRLMLRDDEAPLPGHGLGFELNQPGYQGALAGPRTVGHTGFTGTCLILHPDTGIFLVLLSNAVHPYRGWSSNAPRAVAATRLAHAAGITG